MKSSLIKLFGILAIPATIAAIGVKHVTDHYNEVNNNLSNKVQNDKIQSLDTKSTTLQRYNEPSNH